MEIEASEVKPATRRRMKRMAIGGTALATDFELVLNTASRLNKAPHAPPAFVSRCFCLFHPRGRANANGVDAARGRSNGAVVGEWTTEGVSE
jgi:hypothetical protein